MKNQEGTMKKLGIKAPLSPQYDHPQDHTEDVVRYREDPADRAEVKPRLAKERKERSGHHSRHIGNPLHGSLI
jgi:hypothetical protein